MEIKSDFFSRVAVRLHSRVKADMSLVPELMECGKRFIMSTLSDARLKAQFENDAMMYYYNVACTVFSGGVAFADAWCKDIAEVKLGAVDALLAAQPEIVSLAADILGITDTESFRSMLDGMFGEFLMLMEPYWDKNDPRPFLFQGLLAFFQTGASLRLK